MIIAAVSIDTEVDHRGDAWIKTAPMRFRSIVEGIPGPFQHVFEAHAARPTYLLTTEVMDDAQSVEVLRRVQDAELGTHLHGDHVPPEARLPDPAGTQSWDFTSCYPEALERAKLEYITSQFQDRFGRAPRSYRAGRYAASGRSARILSELGYVAETSVTPGIRWVHEFDPSSELDFRYAPLDPYRPSAADLAQRGQLPIWEIPITIVPSPAWRALATRMYQKVRGLDLQDYPLWLRPSTTSWAWLQWIVRERLRHAATTNLTVFNIMLHS